MPKVIEINNLGKQYQRRELGSSRYQTLREVLGGKQKKRGAEKDADYFWALRNINLTIEQGSVVGVIGPNGAGKSTLLKLLSRVTAPTEGSFKLRGRVASMLEVGTGFHPELTGRENIFLSGAIMGMKRAEIKARFDEIVVFSGVADFLDLPVKRYSSGMYVRLGFAIAAHLEAEILLVDEVLAVGDAEFQKKCLGKIGDVAQGGRTVLFVSHNLNSIQQLCSEVLLLKKGKVELIGSANKGIRKYLGSVGIKDGTTKEYFDIEGFKVSYSSNDQKPFSITLEVGLKNLSSNGEVVLGFVIRNLQGISVLGVNNHHYQIVLNNENNTSCKIVIEIPELPLLPGRYILDLYFHDMVYNIKESWTDVVYIDLPIFNGISFSHLNQQINQVVIPDLKWMLK